MKSLTRTILDAEECHTPGCQKDHSILYILAKCHPKSGLEAVYHKPTGLLRLTCCECEEIVADFQIAEE